MKGVYLGNYHTYDDFSLLINSKEIGTPEPKKKTVEVEGASTEIDFSEYFGDINYTNRELKFECSTLAHQSLFLPLFSKINDAIHGKKVRIVLEDDPDFFYVGRVTVSPFRNEKGIGKLTITVDCEPFKYKQDETVVTKAISGSGTITLANSRKRVVPTITTDAVMTFTFGGTSYATQAGTFTIPELELVEGDNIIEVTGTGNVSFVYREGRL